MKQIIVPLFLLTLIACSENFFTDLKQENEIQRLVTQGWLPSTFLNFNIMEGFEIHDIDKNNIWIYIKSDDANILSRCNKEKLLVTPPNPPIKFRKYWDDDIAKNEMVFKCVNQALHFMRPNKIIDIFSGITHFKLLICPRFTRKIIL